MKFILPLIIVLIGVGGGGAAGYFLSPEPEEPSEECVCAEGIEAGEHGDEHGEEMAEEEVTVYEYVNLKNQFIVPIIDSDQVTGMVVMSLSIEIEPGATEAVYAREPKLRDEFLRVLFGYASVGAFAGNYLEANDMKLVRNDLTQAAQKILGPISHEVLIVDMIRQDL